MAKLTITINRVYLQHRSWREEKHGDTISWFMDLVTIRKLDCFVNRNFVSQQFPKNYL